jgi:hypothetical protein
MPHPVQVALMVRIHPSMDIIGGNLQLHVFHYCKAAPEASVATVTLHWRGPPTQNECLISGWRLVHTPGREAVMTHS